MIPSLQSTSTSSTVTSMRCSGPATTYRPHVSSSPSDLRSTRQFNFCVTKVHLLRSPLKFNFCTTKIKIPCNLKKMYLLRNHKNSTSLCSSHKFNDCATKIQFKKLQHLLNLQKFNVCAIYKNSISAQP